ncbi:Arc family DNA-binding protein [Serratia ficaria]|uniref:Arc family DNA-binding protein n=1 Tax=Serratia ficaria TaxID=61651 RepID=UPI00291660E6|nr:Arc family DNA-binding protein [Serratia ficaria]
MKVKENMGDDRGRPRKFAPGEITKYALRIPENLLNELRVSARIQKHSLNDEILSRLMLSLNYSPKRPVSRTEEAEQLIILAREFAEFLESKKKNYKFDK